ncbi:DUF4064 domain-containing protein [Rhizobium ruizarguesonis]
MAKRFESLNKLYESIRESSHDFRITTAPFQQFDAEQLERTLELEEKGRTNGSANLPAPASKEPDEVEKTIIERVVSERDEAYRALEDRLEDYSTRIRNFDFDGHFSHVRMTNNSSVDDFRASVASGRNDLHALRKLLRDADVELADFRERNGLQKRVAQMKTSGFTVLKWMVIVVLLLLETVLNGVFLAEGSDQGLLGGYTLAFAFAFGNVALTVINGLFVIPKFVHRSIWWKVVGFLGILLWIFTAVGINFVLAHYREVSQFTPENMGSAVMDHIVTATFAFTSINSWILFVSGLIFSLIALVDTLLIRDPYPGYAGTYQRFLDRQDDYIETMSVLIEDLKKTRDEHNSKVEDIIRALSNRRKDSASAIDARSRMIKLFAEHQIHLETVARRLLGTYREANRKTRTAPEPARFSAQFKLERRKADVDKSSDWSDKELADRINAAQAELIEQMSRISTEFDNAVTSYRELDNLFPETINGATRQA